MKCKECGNQQFYTRRKDHKAVAFVCNGCGLEVPIKKGKSLEIKENKEK